MKWLEPTQNPASFTRKKICIQDAPLAIHFFHQHQILVQLPYVYSIHAHWEQKTSCSSHMYSKIIRFSFYTHTHIEAISRRGREQLPKSRYRGAPAASERLPRVRSLAAAEKGQGTRIFLSQQPQPHGARGDSLKCNHTKLVLNTRTRILRAHTRRREK